MNLAPNGVALELAACGLVPELPIVHTKEAAGTAFWWGWVPSSRALSGSFVSWQAQHFLSPSRAGLWVSLQPPPLHVEDRS